MSPSGVRRQLGQLVMLGFDGIELPVELRSLARDFDLGGVVLFSRNIESAEQVAALSAEAFRLAADPPAWTGVDQEGGRVARLKRPFTEWPPAAALGHGGGEDLAARFGSALARELRSVGIALDFAPVLDVLTNPENTVIGDRAIASEPAEVARLGCAMLRAMQDEGLAACGKHFPGHGDTSADSHLELPVVDHGPDRLKAVELVPFDAAIRAGVASIMVAHVLVPSLDERNPASLSPAIVTGLLRQSMGFGGVVFTDDISMKACADRFTPEQAIVAAVNAGCDGVLLCAPDASSQASALEALVRAVETREVAFSTVEKAIARQRRAKERYLSDRSRWWRGPSRWQEMVGCDAHRRIAAEMEALSS